ncbi:MAG: TolC family protein, partial [Leptospira sp.]|nr:TolC family protein [Leptospira sp.]
KENVFGFTNSHLTLPEKPNGNISFRTKAMKAMADNAEIQVSAERAKFLPKIGAFAEMNQYGGNRGTAGSYNAGVYLQMNLFSPSDYGAVDQAKLNSEAVRSRAEETKLKEETQLAQLLNSEIVLKTNIPLLQENLQLSEEQISTGRKLFLSGSITALQLAEILSRYTDILLSLAMAEQEYLNTRVALFALTYDGKKEF